MYYTHYAEISQELPILSQKSVFGFSFFLQCGKVLAIWLGDNMKRRLYNKITGFLMYERME